MRKQTAFTLTELLVVLGIFGLIATASLLILSSGRLSTGTGEAQIQATENTRLAMTYISKDLRLSSTNRVSIYADLATTSPYTGSVVYFQIPLGSYADDIILSGTYTLIWGSEDTANKYIYYYLGGADGDRLFRGICSSLGSGSSTGGKLIAQHISAITFSRVINNLNLINIQITAQGQSASRAVTHTLHSSVKLRN